ALRQGYPLQTLNNRPSAGRSPSVWNAVTIGVLFERAVEYALHCQKWRRLPACKSDKDHQDVPCPEGRSSVTMLRHHEYPPFSSGADGQLSRTRESGKV